jgi:hypothetical protein
MEEVMALKTGRVARIDEGQAVCVDALMNDRCALQAATGDLALSGDRSLVYVALGATAGVLNGLKGLRSFTPGGSAWKLFTDLATAPIRVYNVSESGVRVAGREPHETDTQQEG